MSPELATPRPDDTPERFFQRVYRLAWILTLIGVLVIISWRGASLFALNFAIGACVSVVVLRSTQMLVQRYLVPVAQPRGQRWRFLLLLFAKLPVLIILLFLITGVAWFRPLGLVFGVSIMPVAISLYGVRKILTRGL